jgi:hypothetical protein
VNLAANLRTQPVGVRPTVALDPTSDHPLAVEQRTGITLARVQAIAERLCIPIGLPAAETRWTGRGCVLLP